MLVSGLFYNNKCEKLFGYVYFGELWELFLEWRGDLWNFVRRYFLVLFCRYFLVSFFLIFFRVSFFKNLFFYFLLLLLGGLDVCGLYWEIYLF